MPANTICNHTLTVILIYILHVCTNDNNVWQLTSTHPNRVEKLNFSHSLKRFLLFFSHLVRFSPFSFNFSMPKMNAEARMNAQPMQIPPQHIFYEMIKFTVAHFDGSCSHTIFTHMQSKYMQEVRKWCQTNFEIAYILLLCVWYMYIHFKWWNLNNK